MLHVAKNLQVSGIMNKAVDQVMKNTILFLIKYYGHILMPMIVRSIVFCSKDASLQDHNRNRQHIVYVRTLIIGKTIMKECIGRTDSFSLEVLGRLQTCNDLVGAEAIYHKACRGFFSKLRLTSEPCSSETHGSNIPGRPISVLMSARFEELGNWLESENNELLALAELHKKLCSLSNDVKEDVYSIKHFRSKIIFYV